MPRHSTEIVGDIVLRLRIIEGHNRFKIATVTRDGIRYRGRFFQPISVSQLGTAAGQPGGAIAGAAAGGLLLGGAGLVAGALIGGRGRIPFIIQTKEGQDLVGTISGDEYPELYVEIERLKSLAVERKPDSGVVKTSSGPFWLRLILGPFYFCKFGPVGFVVASSFTVLTAGLGWLILPFVAPMFEQT